MTLIGHGDLAQYHLLRRDGAGLQRDLTRLTGEMSSGRVSDLGRATGGDFSALADISRGLRLNGAFLTSLTESAIAAEGRQLALGRFAAELEGFAPGLLAVTTAGNMTDLHLRLVDSAARLDHGVSALNTQIAGQSLFAGDAPDRPALISGEAMLAELRPLVAGATTAAQMVAEVEAWFTSPVGGFETVAWQGGPGAAAPVLLSEGVTTDAGVNARDPALRDALMGLALAALAQEQAAPLDETEQRALVVAASGKIQSGETGVIIRRAELGAAEARIEEARAAAQATRTGLEIRKAGITEADPYRTATELQALTTRLETHYALTARLSRLNLTEYLR